MRDTPFLKIKRIKIHCPYCGSLVTKRAASYVYGKNAKPDTFLYEARSNIMWCATWALNTLVAKGKSTDWMVHMLGQAIVVYTNATHGMTLAAVSLPYYRYIMPYGLSKFKRFAVNVWGVNAEGKTDEQTASEGLKAMENWMKKLVLVLHTGEFGVTEADAEKIADLVLPMNGGYKALDREEIVKILKESI